MYEADDSEEGIYVSCDDTEEIIDIDPSLDQCTSDEDNDPGISSRDMDSLHLDDKYVIPSSSAAEHVTHNDAVLTFTDHKGSVFCVDCSMRNGLVVSGGEDDVAYIWNVISGVTLLHCAGHRDSVTCVGFSHDALYVATGDMSGLVKVWSSAESWKEIWSADVDELEWLQWHHSSHVLVVGTKTGDIWMWLIPSGVCKTFAGHGCRCSAGRLLPDGKRLCAGYDDGTVKLWDLKLGTCVNVVLPSGCTHSAEVTAIDCHANNSIVITGSLDATALLINTHTGKVLTRLVCSDQSLPRLTSPGDAATADDDDDDDDVDCVEAVGFSHSHSYVATATHFGVLGLWETSSFNCRHLCRLDDGGIVRLRWHTSEPMVYVCTESGVVLAVDARRGTTLSRWCGHTGNILDMVLAGERILTAGDDGTVRVFSVTPPAT